MPEYKTHNVLHFFLTFFTMGMWLPVWALHSASVQRKNRKLREEMRTALLRPGRN